ncbi:MAG TPA: glycine cleavage system protein GcvH [Candidatus Limnocylindrales bacterium]|nr:glycine cleavage system protein GcvH [Candidatus Limnocylindrales bacterium]
MTQVRGCEVPEDLYYWVEKHVWARHDGDGLLTIGVTDTAQHLAARVVAITAKKVGRQIERGQSVATLESGKWVGPVPAPVDGEIAEVNPAIATDPTIVNSDPYGAGWIVKFRATDWSGQHAQLVTGAAGVEAYRAFLEAEGIACD